MKNTVKSILRNTAKLLLCALMLAPSASAQEVQNIGNIGNIALLFWDYRVVINQTCVRTPFQAPPPASGFDPTTKALKLPGEPLTATGSGLLRFLPGGLVKVEEGVQTEVSMTQIAVGQVPVTPPAKFSCTGNYTLDRRKMTLSLSCEVPTGNPAIKVNVGPQNFEGYVSLDRGSINLTNIGGDIQTITVLVNNVPAQERQRICTQNALATR